MINITNQQFHNYYNQSQQINDFTQNQSFTNAFLNHKNGSNIPTHERSRNSQKPGDKESVRSNKNLKGNLKENLSISSNLNIKEEQYMKNASRNNPIGWTMSPIFELNKNRVQTSESRSCSPINGQGSHTKQKRTNSRDMVNLKEERKKIIELKEKAEYYLDIAAIQDNSCNKNTTTPQNKPFM